MTDKASIGIEKIAALAFKALNIQQIEEVLIFEDCATLTASSIGLMNMTQLLELATGVSLLLIRNRAVKLLINTEMIEQGMLDYDLRGELEYLDLIAQEMADKGTQEYEKDLKFHKVGSMITAAQMLAAEISEQEADPILKKGQNLQNMELGSRERAIETKEFLDELFAFIEIKL